MRGPCIVLVLAAGCGDGGGAADAREVVLFDATPVDAAPDAFAPPDAPDDGMIYLPDIVLIPERMEGTDFIDFRAFSATHPALLEGCVGAAGTRRLLRFDTVTGNTGNADLYIGVPSAQNPLFTWSPAHMHYHVEGYAEYRLVDDGGLVVAGHKQAFCLLDTIPLVAGVPGKYHCGNQGITVGWADMYAASLDCQWIDVTDVAAGSYTVEVEVNQVMTLEESRYDNNSWSFQVDL